MRQSSTLFLSLALSLLALSCAITPGGGSTKITVGARPEFQLPRIGGPEGMRTLSELRGRVVIVDFWASWCTPCKKVMPFLAGLQARHPEDLTVLGVNVDDDVEAMHRSLRNAPPGFEIVRDEGGQVVETFGVRAMPTTFFLDREGRVVLVHRGFAQGDRDHLERIVENLIRR